jgi:hypothetical protein
VVFTICGVEPRYDSAQANFVLDTDELLSRLEARGIRNVDIARALGLPDSRVPEIKDKRRALKLDEGAKLVRAFGLEQGHKAAPLPESVVRLLVRHIAQALGANPTDTQLQELIADARAFALFVADPKVRSSLEAAEGFFQALRLRRPDTEAEAPPGNDPEQAH